MWLLNTPPECHHTACVCHCAGVQSRCLTLPGVHAVFRLVVYFLFSSLRPPVFHRPVLLSVRLFVCMQCACAAWSCMSIQVRDPRATLIAHTHAHTRVHTHARVHTHKQLRVQACRLVQFVSHALFLAVQPTITRTAAATTV